MTDDEGLIETMDQPPINEATRSALAAPSDQELRIPCYCEENVYRLVSRKLQTTNDRYYVLFVSSETQCVPMFYQLAAKTPTAVCLWDYHVIVLQVSEEAHILDIDSNLPYPCPLHEYLHYAFPEQLPQDYAPLFRVVRAEVFLKNFYSDRMHMFQDDKWSATPPSYVCIQTKKGSNLDSYRIMTWKSDQTTIVDERPFDHMYGAVLNRDQLLDYFGK